MKTPIIIINFKTYEEATGENALNLAKICEKVAIETKTNIAIAVQPTDLQIISKEVKIPVLSQHIDSFDPGKHTGYITAEAVKGAGAIGTLLNHSEHRLKLEELENCVKDAKENNLEVVICAADPIIGKALANLNPEFIAVEPPELIGGKISVSNAQPEIISESVKKITGEHPNEKVIVGAGIHNSEDVKKSINLGSSGVLVASGVVKAENQEQALRELVKGII